MKLEQLKQLTMRYGEEYYRLGHLESCESATKKDLIEQRKNLDIAVKELRKEFVRLEALTGNEVE